MADRQKQRAQRVYRHLLRLPHYDYGSSGAYYVTTVTAHRQPIFDIPYMRKILEEQWRDLPRRFAGIKLDSFVIMPDHIHCILLIDEEIKDAPTLGQVIGAYKSLTAVAWIRYAKDTGLTHGGRLWQPNYYEHVIRNALDLEEKRAYIHNNPIMREMKSQSGNS